jgi:hypothetical protein
MDAWIWPWRTAAVLSSKGRKMISKSVLQFFLALITAAGVGRGALRIHQQIVVIEAFLFNPWSSPLVTP